MNWIIQNWWIITATGGVAILLFLWRHYRANPDATGASIFFNMLPHGDPTGRTSSGLTPRAIFLWLIGMLIVLIANLFIF